MESGWLFFLLLVAPCCWSFRQRPDADPLILTPYLETRNLAKGRHLARVPFTDDLRITSYSGFFTVNKTHNSNLFFWYFPAMGVDTITAPVLLWLQGGPGSSSLFALLTEIGPIQIRNSRFMRRKFNWALNHNLLFIDSPVGTGFSFTSSSEGYRTEQTQIGEDLYSAVVQFFQLFPELQQNKFFLSGESYSGKYVPNLAYTIHKKNPTATLKINLKGISIGNGIMDPQHQLSHGPFLHQIGLLDYNQAQIFEKYQREIVNNIKLSNWEKATEIFTQVFKTDVVSGESIFTQFTGFEFYYNYLHANAYIPFEEPLEEMLRKRYVRQDLHVGLMPFRNGTKVRRDMILDWMKSVAPWLLEVIDNYKVMIYSGQLDVIVPFPMTENFLRHLNFRANEEYRSAKRKIWRSDGDIAGYVKRAGNLVEVLVRNVGHMVPTDNPKLALELITRFTSDNWDNL